MPSFKKTGSGKLSASIKAFILLIPEPTCSTICIRANNPKINGLRVWLRLPNSASGIALTNPPGLDISTRSSKTSILITEPLS